MLIFIYSLNNSALSTSVKIEEVKLSEVRQSSFEDSIIIRGAIEPKDTVFLDAMEGGRIEEVYVESGQLINQGDSLAKVSNTKLQLEVISRQTQIIEQQNILRSLEIELEQNRLKHKRSIIQLDYDSTLLQSKIGRLTALKEKGTPSAESVLEDLNSESVYLKELRKLIIETQKSDEKMQHHQLRQLKLAEATLKESLQVALDNLETLNVKAPISGRLTSFEIKIGQSLTQGERIGQIDSPTDYKVTAEVDEFYLSKVKHGLKALYTTNDDSYFLTVSKIYPQVINNKFRVEFLFEREKPDNLHRGQTLNIKLLMSDSEEALVMDNGAFYQTTGGSWLFVMTQDSNTLTKRQVSLGRKNAKVVEVIDGLNAGDVVLISDYENFSDYEILNLIN